MTFFIGKGGVSIKWNGPQQLMSIFTDLLFACYGMLSQLTSTKRGWTSICLAVGTDSIGCGWIEMITSVVAIIVVFLL